MNKLCKHLRIVHPQLSRGSWILECSCGWRAAVSPERPAPMPALTREQCDRELNLMFRLHVPAAELRTYVLVDQRPDHVGNWIMPEGIEVNFHSWREGPDAFIASVSVPGEPLIELPVGEIRTTDGRVFRPE